MDKIFLSQANQQTASPHPTNNFLSPSPPSHPLSFTSHVSPNILLIIIILAIIFFISGLLHLLVRFLLRPSDRDQFDDVDNNNHHLTALQGQLQQLFHLHDCGVDQSFIDTLPVFKYEDVVISGNKKSPFDCAVCLSEFEGEDKLRLLPKCSHAFHMECIDTWLLSHSTCPLCRFNLVSDFSPNHSRSPIVLVLESGSDNSSREIILEREMNHGSTRIAISPKSCDNEAKDEEIAEKNTISKEKVVTIKLGKYRNVDGGGEGSSESNVNERRCFSMGSFAYIVDDNTSLQVPIRTPMKKPSVKKTILPLTPGHRAAMSECGYDSRRDFYMLESFKTVSEKNEIGNNGKGSKRESFSVSKIWMRGKKERGSSTVGGSSRRAFSFRFPVHGNGEELKGESGEIGNRGTISEIDFGSWDNGNCSELGFDEESQRGNNRFDSQPNAPSFARRTLLWLVGRQNKVVHSSFPPNS